MLNIGCHLSVSKGYTQMGKDALKINANTFQFFTRNPRGSRAKEINPKDIEGLLAIVKEHQFATILAHAPYTLNACSKEEKTREFAKMIMIDDLNRMEYLPGSYYNFHPGTHGGQGVEIAIDQIANHLNQILSPEQKTTVLLETMSGKGTEVGKTFEELRAIMDKVILKEKLGVCLDTCHVFDGGYDIVNQLDDVIAHFDKVIGLEHLLAIHVNDSMNPFNSHKDRHAAIGEGYIGLEAIVRIINHPLLKHLPFYLETPQELEGYGKEIAMLRSLYKE